MATVAISNSTHAALLAAQIIGQNKRPTLEDMQACVKSLEEVVIAKVDTLEGVGWEVYVEEIKQQ